MVRHELATNAALSKASGQVSISWKETAGKVVLDWKGKDGPPLKQKVETGFGTDLIKNEMRANLQGEAAMNFRKTGLQARLGFEVKEEGDGDDGH